MARNLGTDLAANRVSLGLNFLLGQFFAWSVVAADCSLRGIGDIQAL